MYLCNKSMEQDRNNLLALAPLYNDHHHNWVDTKLISLLWLIMYCLCFCAKNKNSLEAVKKGIAK